MAPLEATRSRSGPRATFARTANAVAALAYRDLIKFLRDPARIMASLVVPVIFLVILGGSLQSNLGAQAGYNFLAFTLTGVYAQTLFQSATFGIISLIADREEDFSQEIFVSPISRYAIIFGKILGESLVALLQGLAILIFAPLLGIPLSLGQLLGLVGVGIVVCLFGGAFGILILANLNNRRAAEQVFPIIMLPQYFLAGIFNPIKVLPWYVDILSRISPLRYAVDLTRNVYYGGTPEGELVILQGPLANIVVVGGMFAIFLIVGTILFVRKESNR